MNPRHVLIAPLDWGLGHATRCIPIVRQYLAYSCEVTIAGSGKSLTLLKMEFPQLNVVELPAYNPQYPSRGSMTLAMMVQLPKFIRAIKKEHALIEKTVEDKHIDIVISDNRFGCWSHKSVNIFITHQLNILMPPAWAWLSRIVNYLNHRKIRMFDECWIPDYTGEQNLTGKMSAWEGTVIKYIGTISRFKPCPSPVTDNCKFDILVMLSGPEPQRTMLEELLINQINKTKLKVMMVRGIPGHTGKTSHSGFECVDFLNGEALQEVICQSKIIIARSGYSTLMDMSLLRKRVIFIPTPGQMEQVYLADRMKIKRIAYFAPQCEFNLVDALEKSKAYTGFEDAGQDNAQLKNAIIGTLR